MIIYHPLNMDRLMSYVSIKICQIYHVYPSCAFTVEGTMKSNWICKPSI